MAKTNSLEDPEICRALYRASQAGVKVMLNVRGICCLRPGVTGVSENIEVRSIIDRFLEHARVFYFRNGGHEEVYLSSADWMRRNLSKRLELLFPVTDPSHRRRLIDALRTYFDDNVKAWRLSSDGTLPAGRPQGSAGPRPAEVLPRGGRCGPRRRPRGAPVPPADAAEADVVGTRRVADRAKRCWRAAVGIGCKRVACTGKRRLHLHYGNSYRPPPARLSFPCRANSSQTADGY